MSVVDVRSFIDSHRAQLPLTTPSIVHRKLAEPDLGALRLLHQHLFPIDYDASFYTSAVNGDGILGIAAVLPQTAESSNLDDRFPDPTTVFVGNEQLVGFITARQFKLHEIPPTDRQLLGFGSKQYDNETVMYILTLGVAESFRKQGIARSLLARVENQAAKAGCSALYLHVITYNVAAANFYQCSGFSLIRELKDFYYIKTGRALHPDVRNYDAYVFKKDVSSFQHDTINNENLNSSTAAGNAYLSSSSSSHSHSSLYHLWEQFTKVCLPFGGGNYRRRKERYYQIQQQGGKKENIIASGSGSGTGRGTDSNGTTSGGAPSWLRGLFASVPPPSGDSAHTA
jgi:ribosomal protein S18 acetylase RimI-like enzyme